MGNENSIFKDEPSNYHKRESILHIDEMLLKSDNTVPRFDTGLKNRTIIAKVVEIVDGDTITINTFINNNIYSIRIRIYGINAPELHPRKNEPYRNVIISMATRAKSKLEYLILNKIVVLECKLFDNFGRLIAKVKCPSINTEGNYCYGPKCLDVSDYLLQNKLVIPFLKSKGDLAYADTYFKILAPL